MDNDELVALILPWAKAHHPQGYAKTLAVAHSPTAFTAHLLRLVEIRCERDPAWRNTVPLRILDATKLAVTVKHNPTGRTMVVGGVNAPPGTNDLRFVDLTWLTAEDIVPVLDSIAIFQTERA